MSSDQQRFAADFSESFNGGDGATEWTTLPSMWRPLARTVDGFDTHPAVVCPYRRAAVYES